MVGNGPTGESEGATRRYCCIIVDDHRLFAESLKLALEREFTCCDCLVVESAREALELASQERGDLFFVDVHLPDMSGIELARRLLTMNPSLRVVMLTVDDSPETVSRAIAAGVSGYLLKTVSLERMYKDIAAILEGDVVIGVEVASILFERLRKLPKPGGRRQSLLFEHLSPREREVLLEVAQGKDNQAIAKELFISEKTVKNHLAHIMEKTGVRSRLQLVVLAIQEGLLEGNAPSARRPQ
jgi:DNA-binding NarL/FixJ family response regulator